MEDRRFFTQDKSILNNIRHYNISRCTQKNLKRVFRVYFLYVSSTSTMFRKTVNVVNN